MKTRSVGRILGWVLALVVLGGIAAATSAAEPSKETPAQRDARMHWWREARAGMFIHWGLYAVPAGQWNGKPAPSLGEWIMDAANIPVAEYEKLAAKFNPVKFDAAAWVATAKNAGLKYIVITSKHHDGFCLWDSKVTDYDVVDATPYRKDLLKQLADECKKQDIKFCLYHSIMDWHHPAQDRGSNAHYNPTKMKPGRKAEYVAYMKAQLKELLVVCDPAVLWFDGEWCDWWKEEDAADLYAMLRAAKPSLIINNRIGKGREGMQGMNKKDREYSGDFGTPEQEIPPTGLPDVDWESCMTMNDTWGFRSDDNRWKSTETLVRNLIDIASKGGNYLLNVGPTAEGKIPAASIERLAGMGKWMKVNGRAIWGTKASPLVSTPWGRCTSRTTRNGNTRLYLHVFQWPADGKLVVAAVATPVRARLLDGRTPLEATAEGGKIVVKVPAKMPDPIATVIALDVTGLKKSEKK